jgi:hypothetical protein
MEELLNKAEPQVKILKEDTNFSIKVQTRVKDIVKAFGDQSQDKKPETTKRKRKSP